MVAFPDSATRAPSKPPVEKLPDPPHWSLIPCSVMFGSGSVAKILGFFRLYAQLVYSRRADSFGTPTLDPDSAKALYYQGVPPAKIGSLRSAKDTK